MAAKKRAATPGAKARGDAGEKPDVATGSHRVDERIRAIGGWRADTLTRLRRLIHEAVPDITEDCKWQKPSNPHGVPVWSDAGIVCTGESYQQVVKLTFAHGASLPDPKRLFNASLAGNTRRAIDLREGELPDADAFKALIRAAADRNRSAGVKPKRGDRC